MKIYNRWGEQLFEGLGDRYHGWDGTHDGEVMTIGNYTYQADILFFDGSSIVKSGSVLIYR